MIKIKHRSTKPGISKAWKAFVCVNFAFDRMDPSYTCRAGTGPD